MSRSDSVYLHDILDSLKIILFYTENKTEFEFVNDQMLQDAVIRRFEVIGEASSKISDFVKIKSRYTMALDERDEKQINS